MLDNSVFQQNTDPGCSRPLIATPTAFNMTTGLDWLSITETEIILCLQLTKLYRVIQKYLHAFKVAHGLIGSVLAYLAIYW